MASRPFPGDADAPAQNIDLPDRMGVRIDAHEASGRQRSSEAQCIFGSAFTNAPHPAAKRAVKSSGLGGDVDEARTPSLLLATLRTVVRTPQPLFSSSAIQLPARKPDPPVTRTRPRLLEDLASLAPAFRVRC